MAFLTLSCLPSPETKQPKVIETQPLSLKNDPEGKARPVVEKEWRFEQVRVEKIKELSPQKIWTIDFIRLFISQLFLSRWGGWRKKGSI